MFLLSTVLFIISSLASNRPNIMEGNSSKLDRVILDYSLNKSEDVNKLPSGLFPLLEEIVEVIGLSVQEYFITFQTCWKETGSWLTEMINHYLDFLSHLTDRLTSRNALIPVSLVSIAAMYFSLQMLKTVLKVLPVC